MINNNYDKKIWDSGVKYLCGIDEAGRGALAGPVVAAAVIFTAEAELQGINDSKKLSEKKRSELDLYIRSSALAFGIGVAGNEEIDSVNILQATFLAMKRAVDKLKLKPEYILVDGRDFPRFIYGKNNELIIGRALIGGDAKSITIAAASILAKVHRDRMMVRQSDIFPQFGFERHKGYGTEFHREQIRVSGPASIHRKKFIRKICGEYQY